MSKITQPITREQRQAIKRIFDRNSDGSTTYRQFRRRVISGGFGSDRYLMIEWRGMWLGIERDGYTHS